MIPVYQYVKLRLEEDSLCPRSHSREMHTCNSILGPSNSKPAFLLMSHNICDALRNGIRKIPMGTKSFSSVSQTSKTSSVQFNRLQLALFI